MKWNVSSVPSNTQLPLNQVKGGPSGTRPPLKAVLLSVLTRTILWPMMHMMRCWARAVTSARLHLTVNSEMRWRPLSLRGSRPQMGRTWPPSLPPFDLKLQLTLRPATYKENRQGTWEKPSWNQDSEQATSCICGRHSFRWTNVYSEWYSSVYFSVSLAIIVLVQLLPRLMSKANGIDSSRKWMSLLIRHPQLLMTASRVTTALWSPFSGHGHVHKLKWRH